MGAENWCLQYLLITRRYATPYNIRKTRAKIVEMIGSWRSGGITDIKGRIGIYLNERDSVRYIFWYVVGDIKFNWEGKIMGRLK